MTADELLLSLPEPIAVVANGPVHEHGAEIDAHPSVIRFNNFWIRGFEDRVGSKTTVWCVNCCDDVEMRDWSGPILCPFMEGETDGCISAWRKRYGAICTPTTSWLPRAQELARRPTTGIVLLSRMVMHDRIVNAYGFDGNRNGHYWDARQKVKGHDDEKPALAALGKMGIRYLG